MIGERWYESLTLDDCRTSPHRALRAEAKFKVAEGGACSLSIGGNTAARLVAQGEYRRVPSPQEGMAAR